MVEIENCIKYVSKKMKSEDIETAVKNNHENGDGPTKIFRDLGGVVSLTTISYIMDSNS